MTGGNARQAAPPGRATAVDDTDWFAALFKSQGAGLRRYLARLVASPEVAEDLAQEAFARVYTIQAGDLRSPRSFLYRTAHNLAMDHMRHRRVAGADPLEDAAADGIAQETPSAEDRIASKQELDIVRAAILELPPKCRMVFMMLRFEDRSYKEIARHMGLSETMVRKYALRALEYCRKRLDAARCERPGGQ
jgi:RNA polymerase sigma-70 factor (ECF subfamily)